MAFMMPVVKNDYNIYKSSRSRRSSECSNPSSCRSRKVSECSKSEGPSLSTSPGSDFIVGSPHRSIPMAMSSRLSRNSSRNSQSSLQSPSKSTSSSPPKSASSSSLNKFHTRVVDKLKRSLRIKDSRDGGLFGQALTAQGGHPERLPRPMARKSYSFSGRPRLRC
ncbi:LOW QUALITY PROTEIN: arginine/serine-rich protein 1 [Homalodisca vitripennis]|uniref:LOW QUALITY PROTEIN: arginine/serine-rich protein 1 n=1 Tax=Homalodisca vitripennis TaxID=197043 RepID=UPI001EEAE60B|nr:LOW QUALITY PROTEIN: arginine/serine-rich protein 1 [Homalodisca vitripennis]